MNFQTTTLLTTASVLLLSAPALAVNFNFDSGTLTGRADGKDAKAGLTKSIQASYNPASKIFNWSSTFEKKNDELADGLWLVVNDGVNPKNSNDGLAIYYVDGIDNKVSAYEYSGQNNANSYINPGNFLGSTDLTVTGDGVNERTFEFEFDTSTFDLTNVTNPDWKGTAFDNNIGLWVHGVSELRTKYKDDELKQFKFTNQSWYDVEDMDATAVPEPASAAALGLFAVAGAFVKRKKQSA